jgi:hypothetical protein
MRGTGIDAMLAADRMLPQSAGWVHPIASATRLSPNPIRLTATGNSARDRRPLAYTVIPVFNLRLFFPPLLLYYFVGSPGTSM